MAKQYQNKKLIIYFLHFRNACTF